MYSPYVTYSTAECSVHMSFRVVNVELPYGEHGQLDKLSYACTWAVSITANTSNPGAVKTDMV